jgi:hypothetical protein
MALGTKVIIDANLKEVIFTESGTEWLYSGSVTKNFKRS